MRLRGFSSELHPIVTLIITNNILWLHMKTKLSTITRRKKIKAVYLILVTYLCYGAQQEEKQRTYYLLIHCRSFTTSTNQIFRIIGNFSYCY